MVSASLRTIAVGSDDLDWAVQVLRQRREPLVRLAPVFWRPAADASTHHRAFIEHLLSEGRAKAFRTDTAVLVAVPRGEGWLLDDLYVPGSDWASGDGRTLWNALDGEAHGSQVRFVCPTYEGDRAEFAQAAGLTIAESWWLLELSGPAGGEAGVRADLAGAEAITVAAPPVYDPPGPVLFLPSVTDASTALPAAAESAARLGCPAIVVNHVAGDDALAQALSRTGFRQHCDYFTGVIDSI